ncbi:hypothetical protein J6590_077877 [Homalodisca vitripennis]|nr:hypothetical protein J6590_077877 [Homalodisca vitripennis]
MIVLNHPIALREISIETTTNEDKCATPVLKTEYSKDRFDCMEKVACRQVIPGSGVTANVRLSAQHNVAGFPPFIVTGLSTRLRYERKANISPVL